MRLLCSVEGMRNEIALFYSFFFFFIRRCEVGIQELPKDSPLGRLRGSDNVVSTMFFLLTV